MLSPPLPLWEVKTLLALLLLLRVELVVWLASFLPRLAVGGRVLRRTWGCG